MHREDSEDSAAKASSEHWTNAGGAGSPVDSPSSSESTSEERSQNLPPNGGDLWESPGETIIGGGDQ
jgi:anti-sigma factor RsiW